MDLFIISIAPYYFVNKPMERRPPRLSLALPNFGALFSMI